MKILMLAVFLAVIQASAPIPRKTSNPSDGASQDVKQEPNSDKAPSPKSVPIVEAVKAQPNQYESNGPATDNTQKPVAIRELPPVSVTKDRLDKLYIFFTGILIVVGSVGVRAAYRTLKAIERQGVSMRRQTTLLRRSVIFARRSANAARTSADAAKKSADALINSSRAWLVVEIDWDRQKWTDGKFHLLQGSGTSGDHTAFDVVLICRNEGKSPAWIDEKRAVCIFLPMIPPKPRLDATSLLQSGPEPIGIGQSIPHTTNLPWFVYSEGHVAEGKILLIFGVVKYRDPFGSYQTTFGYNVLPSGPVRIEGYPEYNENT